jgi:hypothetical protein
MEGDTWTELVRQTENIRHLEYRVLGVRTVGNIFRMPISSNSSFTTKSCACVSVAFLAGSISWSVDSNYSRQYSFVDCRKRRCEFTYRINSDAEYVHSWNDSRICLRSGTKITSSWTVVLLLVMSHRVRNCQMTSAPLRVCTRRMTFIHSASTKF